MPNFLTSFWDTVGVGASAIQPGSLKSYGPGSSFSPGSLGGYGGGNPDWMGSAGFASAPKWIPGTNTDYAALAGDLWLNSAVAACLNWQITAMPEAPPCLKEKNGKGKFIVSQDDAAGIADLLENPNGAYDDTVLWAGTLISFAVKGDAYWFIVRDRLGRISQVWYVPHFQVQPKWEGGDFISYYEYTVNGVRTKMPVEDVIHFRFGIDPYNPRCGMAPLASIAREVFTDVEATNYTAAILKNMGVVGAIISPKDAEKTGPFDANTINKLYRARTRGDKRGDVLPIDAAIDIHYPDNSPERMALDVIRKYPEARICAVMGIPPQVINLNIGLEHSTYSNMEQAQAAAWQNNLLPTQRMMAKQLTMQLIRRNYPALKKYVVGFDTSEVRALQEDTDALHARAREDWKANLLTRADAKAEIGIDAAEDGTDDIYYADIAPAGSGGFDKLVTDSVSAAVAASGGGPVPALPLSGQIAGKPVKSEAIKSEGVKSEGVEASRGAESAEGSFVTINGHAVFISNETAPGGGQHGQVTESTPSPSAKSMLAKQSAVYVGADIQRYSEEHNEPILASGVSVNGGKGLSLRDNEPVDVIVTRKGVIAHGIELKTMVSNSNNKITMKASAIERKANWMQENNAPLHTVVFDDHKAYDAGGKGKHDDSQRQMYYKRGSGSFRVGSMHPVKDIAELNTLLDTPDAELPVAAKPPKGYVSPSGRE